MHQFTLSFFWLDEISIGIHKGEIDSSDFIMRYRITELNLKFE